MSGELFTYEKCIGCGTERLASRPTPEAIASYYPDSYYAYSGSASVRPSASDILKRCVYEVFWAQAGERSKLTNAFRFALAPLLYALRFRSNLAFRAPALRRVFEIGAATGTDLLEFRAAGWEVAGCEPSSKACAVALQRGIDLQNSTAEDVVLAASQYGCVLINNVFEHLHDPAAALVKAHAALADDGVLVVIVPNHDAWSAGWFGASWPGYDPPRHLWGFTASSLGEMLRRQGFAVERIAHKAPMRWCWIACIEGTRRPSGATQASSRLARLLSPWFLPVGVIAALSGRGDFIKAVARKAS